MMLCVILFFEMPRRGLVFGNPDLTSKCLKMDAVQAAKDLGVMRKAFREIDFAEEPVESRIYDAAVAEGARKPTNSVIQRWLESRTGD